MSPDEIKAMAATLAELYAAKAAGKTLQLTTERVGIQDARADAGPRMDSDLSRWRVKPEPRRMWETANTTVYDEAAALELQRHGMKVTEWQEVLP